MVGLMGMPRRVYTYDRAGSFELYNLLSTIGTWVMTVALLIFLFNMIKSWRSGPRVGNDPWRANTLEWYTTSPPPEHNFDSLPPITSERPLRDLRRRLEDAAMTPRPGSWLRLTAVSAAFATGIAIVDRRVGRLARGLASSSGSRSSSSVWLSVRYGHPDDRCSSAPPRPRSGST